MHTHNDKKYLAGNKKAAKRLVALSKPVEIINTGLHLTLHNGLKSTGSQTPMFARWIIILALAQQACSPYTKVDNFAQEHSFTKQMIATKPFTIASFHRVTKPKHNISIYIEGDGRAWLANGSRISADPTSSSTMLFELANNDPRENIIYMPRPCQHSKEDLINHICIEKYWSEARYSEEIVNSTNQALNKIKQQYHNKTFELVGFSGGGTIAALVASRRNDISKIRTIAGNLDLQAMDHYHKTIPLYESLDPINIAKKIVHIPQVHYVGSKDIVVPPIIAKNFKTASGNPNNITIVEIKGASHGAGWSGNVYD
jgi:hypothetical protein